MATAAADAGSLTRSFNKVAKFMLKTGLAVTAGIMLGGLIDYNLWHAFEPAQNLVAAVKPWLIEGFNAIGLDTLFNNLAAAVPVYPVDPSALSVPDPTVLASKGSAIAGGAAVTAAPSINADGSPDF